MNSKVSYAYTKKGTRLQLSKLGSGGEGVVYEIQGYPKKVAKIYHDATTDEMRIREEKIDAMVDIGNEYAFRSNRLSDDIAWPMAPLYDEQGCFCGFGMNRVSVATELDDLYVYPPKQSQATIKERLTCLISLCDVVERLHHLGQVVGDFNPNNIKIRSDWTVCLVDADSYHISDRNEEYRCVVCAPGYVAPEVIRACSGGITYADCTDTTFTKESDYFALAIHVFRMLMNGCHPFSCEKVSSRVGSVGSPRPIDRKVEKGETPFFANVKDGIAPQYAPDITAFPSYLRELFQRAFVSGHDNPYARPNAAEWRQALSRYRNELAACKADPLHFFWKRNRRCPYCEADCRYAKKLGLEPPRNKVAVLQRARNNSSYALGSTTTNRVALQSMAANKPSTQVSRERTGSFEIVTVLLSIVLQVILGSCVFPSIFAKIYSSSAVAAFGLFVSVLVGIAGTVLFNRKWAPGRGTQEHQWWEYLLSVSVGAGFFVGFAIAMWLVINCLPELIVLAVIAGIIYAGYWY